MRAVRGYILASSFLDMFKSNYPDKFNDTHKALYFQLHKIMKKFVTRSKIDIKKQARLAWDEITKIGNNASEVKVEAFVTQLIVLNPYFSKYPIAYRLAKNLNKEFWLSKDEVIQETKRIVREFYKGKNK